MATPFRTQLLSALLLVMLLANQLLAVIPAQAAPPVPPRDTAPWSAPTVAPGRPGAPALSSTPPDEPAPAEGRLLFAPVLDSDGDPATNPVAGTPVPVIRFVEAVGGMIVLAAQLEGTGATYSLRRVPVTFRVWNKAGVVSEQTLASDVWGAAQADVRIATPDGEYHYQVSAPGFGTSETRTFRFDPAHAGMTIHVTGATLTYETGADGELHFTLTSPMPLESGRDEAVLVIARRPTANANDSDSLLQPVLESVNAADLRLPFPRLPMEIVDTHRARLTIRLPAGDYRFVGSLTVATSEAHAYFTTPLETLLADDTTPLPEARAIWIANLEHEAGQTLVQYERGAGESAFALIDSTALPTLAPRFQAELEVVQSWRTGAFRWLEQEYTLTTERPDALAISDFAFDPIARRYDVTLTTLKGERRQTQMRVEVLGAGGAVLQSQEAALTLDPAAPTHYRVEVPTALGRSYGVRLSPLSADAEAGQVAAHLVAESPVDQPLPVASPDMMADQAGDGALLAQLRTIGAQVHRIDPGKQVEGPGFSWGITAQIEFYLRILESEIATLTYTYKPGEWEGAGPDWIRIAAEVVEGALYYWWEDTKLTLVSGGVELSVTAYMNWTADGGRCPSQDWQQHTASFLKKTADDINRIFDQEEEPAGTPNSEDPPMVGFETPPVPAASILMVWAKGDFGLGPDVDAEDVTIQFGFKAKVDASINVGIDFVLFDPGTVKAFRKIIGYHIKAVQAIILIARLKNPGQGKCTPPLDRKPADDRQDVWQGIGRLAQGATPDVTLGNLTMLIERARALGLTRAETYLTLQLRQTELTHVASDTTRLFGYMNFVENVAAHNSATLRGILDGTIPISPTQTITEALIYQNDQAAQLINIQPFAVQMQQVVDNHETAQHAYLLLYGQELELELELRRLFFSDTIGVVGSGFPYATLEALREAGVAGQVISLSPEQQEYRYGTIQLPAPYVSPTVAPRALIMPSGGMHTLAGSPEARAWLEEYVRGGGTLLVFTQSFGTDWNALPGGEVHGIGYDEDQRCEQESVRAAMSSPWLAWMGVDTPDIQVDGAFTAWPENANILLVRTSGLYQGYPAMIEYEWGAGRVIATSAYGDWVTQTGMSWGDDWQMTRTMLIRLLLLAQGRDIEDVQTTAPDSDVTVSFPITHTGGFTATQVRVELPVYTNRLPGYTGNIVNIPLTLAPGETTTLNPMLHTAPVMRGVHNWTQVGLFNLLAKVTAAPGEPYTTYPHILHVQSPLPPVAVGLTLNATPVTARPFQPVTVTATIRNFSDTSQTFTLTGVRDLPGDPIELTVAARGVATHTYTLPMDRSYIPQSTLLDGNGESVATASLAVHIANANLSATPRFPYVIESGAPLTITVHNRPDHWRTASDLLTGQIQLTLTSPTGEALWNHSQPIPPLAAGRSVELPMMLGTLPPGIIGTYQLEYALFDEGEQETEGTWRLASLPEIAGYPTAASYQVRETVRFSATLHNDGRFDLTPNVIIGIPALGITTTQTISLPAHLSATIPFSTTIPGTATSGTYPIVVQMEEGNTRELAFRFTIAPSLIMVQETPETNQAPGETLTVTLSNIGGVDTVVDSTLTLIDGDGVVVAQTTDNAPIQAGAFHPLTLPIPGGVAGGDYRLLIDGVDTVTRRPFRSPVDLEISGSTAALYLRTDQPVYTPDDRITVVGSVTATAGVVTGTLHLNISPAMPDEIIVGAIERVNANDEIGHVSHNSVQLAYDGAGNAYALWSDDRGGGGDIYFRYRPVGGAWQPSVRVNTMIGLSAGNPDLVVDAAGNAWAAWTGASLLGGNKEISAAYRPAGGTWSDQEQVAFLASGILEQPALALGGDGSLYVAWEQDSPNTDWHIYFAMRSPDGVWIAAERVTDNSTTYVRHAPAIVVDSANAVHVVWEDSRQTNNSKIYYANRPMGGVWSANSVVAATSARQYQPALTIDATDTLYAVWFEERNPFGIIFATRPANGNWSASQRATTGGDFNPQVAIASSGMVHVVFKRNFLIYHAMRGAGGGWSSATRINDTTVGGQDEPTIAVATDGTVLAAWEDSRGPQGSYQPLLRVDERPVATGAWGTDLSLSDATGNADQRRPDVTIDANGTLHAVWEDGRFSSGSGVGVYYASKPHGGSWSVNERVNGTVPANPNGGYPTLAIDGSGSVVALWQAYQPDLFSADRSGASVWSIPVQLDAPGASVNNADVAMDSSGNGYAVWTNSTGNNDIYFAYRPSGGTWGTGVRVNDDIGTRPQTDGQIALDGAGNAYALWQDERNITADIYFAYRPAGGAWGPNVRVNTISDTHMPTLWVDAAGNAHAAWVVSNQIYRAARPAGGVWNTPQMVAVPPTTCAINDPVIAVHPDGAITVAWEDCGIQLTHRSPDGHWYDPVRVADVQEQFGSDDEIKMVLDGSGNAHLVWEAEPSNQYDIHHAVVYLPQGTMQVWERDLPINTATSQPISETVGVPGLVPGKYYLSGVLTNPLSQTMTTDSFPFYILPAGIELTLESDKAVYRPDETITVTGYLTNTSDTSATYTLVVMAGTQTLLEQPYTLAAGEGVMYSMTTTAIEDVRLTAEAGGAEIEQSVRVRAPEGTAQLTVPAVVGHDPFTATVTVSNTGLVPLLVDVVIADRLTQSLSVAPGNTESVTHTLVVTETTPVTASVRGDLTQDFEEWAEWGEGGIVEWGGETLPPEFVPGETAIAGLIPFVYRVTGGLLSTPATLGYSVDAGTPMTQSLTLDPELSYTNTLLIELAVGTHVLDIWLADSNGAIFSEDTLTVTVHPNEPNAPPRIEILDITMGSFLERGESVRPFARSAIVQVTIANNGPSAPIVAGVQIADTPQQWVITPTAYTTETHFFPVTLPDDLPAGDYIGHVIVDDQSLPFTIPVVGSDIDLALALDESSYALGESVSLTVTLTEQAGLSGNYPLALRYGTYEEVFTATVPAGAMVQHTFTFTATESDRASITLAQHLPAGQRVIMIDSLSVEVVEPSAEAYLTFDKSLYAAGDPMTLTVVTTGSLAAVAVIGPLELMMEEDEFLIWSAPVSTDTFEVVTGTYPISYTLPAQIRTGQYTFDVNVNGESHLYTMDVRGWSVTTRRMTLNQAHYSDGDPIAATAEFFNEGTTPIEGLAVTAYIIQPDGDLIELPPSVSEAITLTPGLNEIKVAGTLATDAAGQHTLLVTVAHPDELWPVAGASALFDVGSAHLVELTTNHGIYAPGQAATGQLDVYGHGATQLVVTASDGSTVLNMTPTLAGFETFSFAIPTTNEGDYLLTATSTDVEGTDDTLTRAYAVPPPLDGESPIVTLTYPTTTTILTSDAPTMTITVTGNASDNREVVQLLVNGNVVTPTLTGAFNTTITLRRGTNGVSATALDPSGNLGYSPLVPLTLVPTRSSSLTVSQTPAPVGTTIFFQSVMTAGDGLSDVLWYLPLPTSMVTDVVVMASSGTPNLNTITPGVLDAVWYGNVTEPVTVTVSVRLISPGFLTPRATVFWGWSLSDTDSVTVEVVVPTGVTLADFSATPLGNVIRVTWETASETDNLGFNLWRGTAPDAPSEQLNDELIESQSPGGGQGAMYEWPDDTVITGTPYFYWLDAVSVQGTITRYGPVSATVQPPTALTLSRLDARSADQGVQHPSMWGYLGWWGLLLIAYRMRRHTVERGAHSHSKASTLPERPRTGRRNRHPGGGQ